MSRADDRLSTSWWADAVTLRGLLDAAESAPVSHEKGSHGCLFPGVLKRSPGPRRKYNVESQGLLLLDFDGDVGAWTPDDLPWRFVAWETYQSTRELPRFRVVVPLDRPATPEEMTLFQYGVPALLDVASAPAVDPSCLRLPQMAFMPERPTDAPLRTWVGLDKRVLAVDKAVSAASSRLPGGTVTGGKRDPFTLSGVVGACNRALDNMDQLIAEFGLPYVADGDRWRHIDAGQNQPAGVVEVAPGLWFSHHANSDPMSNGHAHTAFDFLRVHLHGGKPELSDNDPSHKATIKQLMDDKRVMAEVQQEVETRSRRKSVQLDGTRPGAITWALENVGTGALSDVMRRGSGDGSCELVSIVHESEDGYVSPERDGDDNGRAQFKYLRTDELHARMDHRHEFYGVDRQGQIRALSIDRTAAAHAVNNPGDLRATRDVSGMTDVPLIRADGSLLDVPGYDPESRLYYAPAFEVPAVANDVAAARERLTYIVRDFPFASDDDRANWLGYLITPVLRLLVPGPYKGLILDAPDAGTGKTLLAEIIRTVYGGAFRGSWPATEEEVGKELTTIFRETEAPVVVFDNVRGQLGSARLESLLTSRSYSQRVLGSSTSVTVSNDRLFLFTANNLGIRGDMARRIVKATIDANQPQPYLRGGFSEPNLLRYVRLHRGRIVADVLTLASSWVRAGMPGRDPDGEGDVYAEWRSSVGAILSHAGLPGEFDSRAAREASAADDEDELALLLRVARGDFGDKKWRTTDLIDRLSYHDDDVWPSDVRNPQSAKAVGKWLGYRIGRWRGDHCLRSDKDKLGRLWWVEER